MSIDEKNELKVLVLGAGGNVSQGIIKAVRDSGIPVRIIGACISEYSKGLYMCDEGYLCPYANNIDFVPWVITFCNENNIDIILTGVEENIIELAKNEERIKKGTKALFISSSYNKLLIGQDKYLTCEFLKESGCNYPEFVLWKNQEKTIEFAEKVGYPIIAKPRNGKSSRGLLVLKSAEDIYKYKDLDKYVLEECIGSIDSEYTIGCYVDKNGYLQRLIPMKRKLWNGTTVWAKTIRNVEIEKECEKICNAFKPKGPLNIQLRLDKDGRPVCFELNVRFSGTTSMRSYFGYKDVKAMILEYCFNESITDCFDYKDGEAFRYDEEFYLTKNATDTMKREGRIADLRSYIFR